ncbi:cytochrome P450 [Actinoallomurus acanthiterrae]
MAVAMTRLNEMAGPVCTFGAGPTRVTFMFGPEANEFIFRNPRLFRWRGGFETLIPLAGETALLVSDGTGHDRRRELVVPAFQRTRIDHYLAVLLQNIDELINGWRPGRPVNLYADFRTTVRASTIRGFFGPSLAAQASELGADLETVLRTMNHSLPKQQILQRVPNPVWRRAEAAIARIDRRVHSEITRRRAAARADAGAPGDDSGGVDGARCPVSGGRSPETAVAVRAHGEKVGSYGDDILGLLLDSGEMSDRELRDMVVSLIVASYDTTSAALAWAVHALWSDREALRRARDEVRTKLGDEPPTLADLRHLTYLDWVTSEVLRLYPPAMAGARQVAEPFTFAGHRVRAGELVVFSQYVTHRLPRLWPDADRFWPERWDRDRPGHRRPSNYEYLPFGVGARRCLGANLARPEITATLARLLQRTELDLLSTTVEPTGFTAMSPKGGVLARVTAVRDR